MSSRFPTRCRRLWTLSAFFSNNSHAANHNWALSTLPTTITDPLLSVANAISPSLITKSKKSAAPFRTWVKVCRSPLRAPRTCLSSPTTNSRQACRSRKTKFLSQNPEKTRNLLHYNKLKSGMNPEQPGTKPELPGTTLNQPVKSPEQPGNSDQPAAVAAPPTPLTPPPHPVSSTEEDPDAPPKIQSNDEEFVAAAADLHYQRKGRSPFDKLSAADQAIVIDLFDKFTWQTVLKLIAQPPPIGFGLKVGKTALYDFNKRYDKRRRQQNVQESIELLNNSSDPTQAFAQIFERLVQTRAHRCQRPSGVAQHLRHTDHHGEQTPQTIPRRAQTMSC